MEETEITMKNTKSEILEALNRALERAEAAEQGRLHPEEKEQEANDRRAVETARKAVEQNIFSKELMGKFNDLETAITVEENRLQELYGIGQEVRKLALVLEAGRERSAAIEAELSEKERTMAETLAKLHAEHAERKTAMQAEHDAYEKKQKVERARENEEYQYNIARTRERENNAWADEKANREAELQKQEARATELLTEAEGKVEYIQSLEEQVKNIPALLAAERETAVAATTETIQREYAHQAALAEMERQNAVARLEDKAAFLERELGKATKATEALQAKLDKAYSEIRDLAAKTVESASGVKIIGGPEKNMG